MVMCSEYVRRIRLLEMAEQDFHLAQIAMMDALNRYEAKSARVTVRLDLKNRDACRVALMFHEGYHECAAASVSV